MSQTRDLINNFDFDTAKPHDLAVLLEQIFMYHDARSRDGGPLITAQGVIQKYEDAVRKKAAPDLYDRVRGRCAELRSTVDQLGTLLSKLEKDSGKASS
jgi:hypothetical protein